MIQIGIIILLAVFVLKELFSFKSRKDDYSKTTDELKREFKRKDLILIVLFPFLLIIVTIGLTNLLDFLSNWSFQHDKEIVHIIKPELGTWIGMAMISTLGYSIFLIFKLVRWIFKSKEYDYWNYYNRKYGFKATGFLKYFGIVSIFIGLVWTLLHFDSYTKFKENRIEINQFESIKEISYDYESISRIIHYQKIVAPNGNIVERPHYLIVFNDNFEWRTNDRLRTPKKSDEGIISFVKEKTGLEVELQDIDQ